MVAMFAGRREMSRDLPRKGHEEKDEDNYICGNLQCDQFL